MLRNRIVSTPHATGCSHDGLIPHTEIDYHVRKAAGGVGLVMTFGSASVDPTTRASYGQSPCGMSVTSQRYGNWQPQVNTSVDAYGGSLENRTRFGREVLEAVRAAVSDDFIVGLRMAVDQYVPRSRARGHAIIADPDLPLKAAAGERKRSCISLNEGCIGTALHRTADVVLGEPGASRTAPRIWSPS